MGLLEERRAASQRQLYALNEGWPFGDGPLQWFCHLEFRNGQAHIVCDQCPQSIFCVAVDYETKRGFTWNLELLKARIADHVLKVHPEAAT